MIVTLNEIDMVLHQLLNSDIPREEASNWATRLMEHNDNDQLEYIPTTSKDEIWDAILFILGIDMLDAPGSYLHDKQNIQDYLDAFTKRIQEY